MNKKMIGIGIVILAIGSFGYYAISPLFNNIKADEALPGSATTPTPKDVVKIDSPKLAPVSSTHGAGTVTGTLGHPASGTALIVEAEGKQYIRYENFKTINGPDIYVYLAKDLDAKDYVNLGKVKATEGNINYEIPAGTNPTDYKYVLTWCKEFGVLFNSAQIN